MGILLDQIGTTLGAVILGGVSALAVVIGAYLKGRGDKGKAVERDRLEAYRETRERMDDVETSDSVDGARERLWKRGER